MAFVDSWNRYSAQAFGRAAADPTDPTSGAGADTVFEQKMIMLRTLQDALADAQRTGDTRALKIYQEQMDAYTASEAARIRIVNTLAANQGRLDAARLQAVQRDIANIRDNQTRLLASDAQRGGRMMQDLVYKAAGADPRLAQAGGPAFRNYVLAVASASLNPSDPATWYAIDALKKQYGEGAVSSALGNLVPRADAAHSQRVGQVQALERVAIPETATGRDVEALLQAAGLTAMERPSFESARTEAGSATGEAALKSDIARLQQDLDLTGEIAAEKPSRLGGLSAEEAQAILADPRFRAYAEDRGFRLSGARADGSYVITPQDIAAMRAAAKEQATGRNPAFRGANQPREQRDMQIARPGAPVLGAGGTSVPLVTFSEASEDQQYAKKAYLTYPDGRVELRNLVTGDVSPVAEAGGRWSGTPAEAAAYQKAKAENGSNVLRNPETGGPLTSADLDARRGNAGLNLDDVDIEARDTPLTGPETFADVRGLRMQTRLGEDPARVVRMLGRDGTTITTYQKGDDGQWRETGKEENAYRGILRRPEADPMAERADRGLRQPNLDRYETPPRPVVDDTFEAQVTGEGVGAAMRKLYTDGPPASNAPPAAFQSGEAVAPGLEGKISAQRTALERMMRAKAGSTGYRAGAESRGRASEQGTGGAYEAGTMVGREPLLAYTAAGQVKREADAEMVAARRQEIQDRLAEARKLKNPEPFPTTGPSARSPEEPGAPAPGARSAPASSAAPMDDQALREARGPQQSARRLAELLKRPRGERARGAAPPPPAPPPPEPQAPPPTPRTPYDTYDPALPAALSPAALAYPARGVFPQRAEPVTAEGMAAKIALRKLRAAMTK